MIRRFPWLALLLLLSWAPATFAASPDAAPADTETLDATGDILDANDANDASETTHTQTPVVVDMATSTDPADTPHKTLEPVPENPLVKRLLTQPGLNDAEIRRRLLFHGRLENVEPQTPAETAALAWAQFKLNDPSLTADTTDPLLRAQACLARGDAQDVRPLLTDDPRMQAAWLRAAADEAQGKLADAVAELAPLRQKLQHETLSDPAELTAGGQIIAALARLEGRPAQDYELAQRLLARVTQTLAPGHWPALVAEGQLLMTKDNIEQAAEAFQAALALNPTASQAWYGLGRIAVDHFNFTGAAEASQHLRTINPIHPLADALDVRSRLRQRDAAGAYAILNLALGAMPKHREFLALHAAAAATAYDDDALAAALERHEQLAPGSANAYLTAGSHLSGDRQYVPAQRLLRIAIERAPNDPAPRMMLGEMLVQVGDLLAAQTELSAATKLDPYHRGANNQLQLVQAMLNGYETLETKHFLIRYRPGIDAALARDMPGPLEDLYDEITAIFKHRPAHRTQIDLMPDKTHFAVRITGMPDFITIAACTGDVIALTPPRRGKDQADPFNWVNVLRHEFVHTVTLAQTQNRIPHWFTEACAVSQETTGRTYDTCQMLAIALSKSNNNTTSPPPNPQTESITGLFDYDQINWGFIRPKTPTDRPLAYAQSDWMLEFIAQHWSHNAIVELLDRYQAGVSDVAALQDVLHVTPDAFMTLFKAWATDEVNRWGLGDVETSDHAKKILAANGQSTSLDELKRVLKEHGGHHPSLLKLVAKRVMDQQKDNPTQTASTSAEVKRWIARYAAARPVDPWPHEALVRLAAAQGTPQEALGSLQMLDRGENYSAIWSKQLADLHRAAKRYDQAQHAINRALLCEPYNAGFREDAATLAMQRGDLKTAQYHIQALIILEPNRAIHQKRLDAINKRLE